MLYPKDEFRLKKALLCLCFDHNLNGYLAQTSYHPYDLSEYEGLQSAFGGIKAKFNQRKIILARFFENK